MTPVMMVESEAKGLFEGAHARGRHVRPQAVSSRSSRPSSSSPRRPPRSRGTSRSPTRRKYKTQVKDNAEAISLKTAFSTKEKGKRQDTRLGSQEEDPRSADPADDPNWRRCCSSDAAPDSRALSGMDIMRRRRDQEAKRHPYRRTRSLKRFVQIHLGSARGFRAPTARRCSRVARRRRSWLPRSAPARTSSTSTLLERHAEGDASCCTTTSALLGRRDRPHGLAGPPRDRSRQARLARDRARSCRGRRTTSPTRCASSPRSPSRTARRRWRRSAAPRLPLMDAGVPLRAPVAGIAMGLIKEGD